MYNCYAKKGTVYVPTVVKLQTGLYMDVEPVAVVPIVDTHGLRRAFLKAIARGNVVVPNPPQDKWPPPVLPKYAGVKTWSAFARGASLWSIKEQDGNYKIAGYRSPRAGYWEPDPEQKIEFPPGSSVDAVVERMIEILQHAGRQ